MVGEAAALAHLYAGHASIDLADWDAAVKHYTAYIDGHAKDDELVFSACRMFCCMAL